MNNEIGRIKMRVPWWEKESGRAIYLRGPEKDRVRVKIHQIYSRDFFKKLAMKIKQISIHSCPNSFIYRINCIQMINIWDRLSLDAKIRVHNAKKKLYGKKTMLKIKMMSLLIWIIHSYFWSYKFRAHAAEPVNIYAYYQPLNTINVDRFRHLILLRQWHISSSVWGWCEWH